jgi:hypothetical protein
MFSTGPMFLTYQASSYPDRSLLDILSPELYGKYVSNSSHSLFRHLKGVTDSFYDLILLDDSFSFILAWK